MDTTLNNDQRHLAELLQLTLAEAQQFLAGLPQRPVGATDLPDHAPLSLPAQGWGAAQTLRTFNGRFAPWLSGSAGPRYFGFVTGGATPAALMGDWLTAVYDQNALGSAESIAPQLELETIGLLRQLFGLPDDFAGVFVTGATMANFVGLAQARQWAGRRQGIDVARDGLAALGPVRVFSGTPHSSIFKALAMLGLGRASLQTIPTLPNREAVDVAGLARHDGPAVVVANAGTVNTVDFDNLPAIAALREQYPFWLHVDGAFGGFAACAPAYRPLVDGLALADSLTIDAHKWLNVPYDAAMAFTRHQPLQAEVFQNAAVYLGEEIGPGNFVHLTPENSRRLRALPAWFTLLAYGRQGYAELVERGCRLARMLGQRLEESAAFELLAPVRLNGICFTPATGGAPPSLADIQHYLAIVQAGGDAFLTPTVYQGRPAIRVSVSNWQTTPADIDLTWQALQQAWQQWRPQRNSR
ncbi:MAG: pyridoxal-dependent decarboxylase [Anaerolineae bacterium]